MRTEDRVFVFFLFLCASVASVNSSKVLFVPMVNGSHLLNHIAIGDKLSRLYHHDVYITVPENEKLPRNLNPVYHHSAIRRSEIDNFITKSMNEELGLFGQIVTFGQIQKQCCDGILKDHEVIREMISQNFDYLVIDSYVQCLYLLPKILKIPYSTCFSSVRFDLPAETGIPVSVTRTPFNPNSKNYSRFSARLKNFFVFIALNLSMGKKIQKEYIKFNKMYLGKDEIIQNSPPDLWIITQSSYFMQPIPRSPAIVLVGGALSPSFSNKIDNDLSNFIYSSKEIILVSFGSMVNLLLSSVTNGLLSTFGELPQFNFIFKFDCRNISAIPNNTKCVNWMPQTEILNLNLTKIFITHGGSNSMHESAMAGVPMIVMPLFADQFYNAMLIEEKGLGKVVNIKQIKNLKAAILDVVNNDSYKVNAVRASRIIRELEPDPAATAAYYLNHAILYGAEHFNNHFDNLWLYQIYMYDIAVVCLMAVLSCAVLLTFVVRKCLVGKFREKKLKDN